MTNKLYVGNLSFDVTEEDLQELFQPHGTIATATLVTDRETGRQRGFGFVEMQQSDDAQKAIASLDGQDFHGRALKVNLAKPREERSNRGGRYGR